MSFSRIFPIRIKKKRLAKIANLLLCFLLILSLSNCVSKPDRRWQKKKEFVKRRDTIYNKFVEGGGFDIKNDEEGRPIIRNHRVLKRASSELEFEVEALKYKGRDADSIWNGGSGSSGDKGGDRGGLDSSSGAKRKR